MLTRILLVAAAGALGTLSRYALVSGVQKLTGPDFPYGTAVVNILGCFLFGALWALAEEEAVFSTEARIIFLAGFMAAFTTFSTFIFESHALVREGEWLLAGINVGGQILVGVIALLAGMGLARVY